MSNRSSSRVTGQLSELLSCSAGFKGLKRRAHLLLVKDETLSITSISFLAWRMYE